MTKRVYLFDGLNKGFNGIWDCQESPLEVGIYITPTASTEVEPPTFNGEEETCIWDGSQWVLTPIPKPVVATITPANSSQPISTGSQEF